MTRLFVALRPPAPLRDTLIDTMDAVEGARWQDEDQLHLTLRFVGEVDPPVAEDLAAALGQVAAPPFTLVVAGAGHFARKGRPTALWAGIAPSPALVALQHKVERACQRVGRIQVAHHPLRAGGLQRARIAGGANQGAHLPAGLGQPPDQVPANEAGGPGNQDHD